MTRSKLIEAPSRFVSSGSALFDLVLGGGWARGRVVNLVGDKSSGKTLLAIEACANFARAIGPEDLSTHIRYAECESAFDDDYANSIGMPSGISFKRGMETVEELFEDLSEFLKSLDGKKPALYVVDSLDALSDDAEMERAFDAGSYGAEKAKKMSKMFRQLTGQVERANCTLMIISQIRDKIGVMFGEKKTRSGGKALDFYASQIIWLSEIGKIQRTVMGTKRTVGVEVKALAKKNKVAMPFRDAELTVLFNYGVDDEESMLNWLEATKQLDAKAAKTMRTRLDKARVARDGVLLHDLHHELLVATQAHWAKIEEALAPPMRKYETNEA